MAAATLDSISAGLVTVLKPGGTPVGTLKVVQNRTPPVPYTGQLPALFIRPVANKRAYFAGRAKNNVGVLELVYLDATRSQQQTTLAAVETAMYANREAIVNAIEGDLHWGSSVTAGGAAIEEAWPEDGPYMEYFGAFWVGFAMRVLFEGLKDTV